MLRGKLRECTPYNKTGKDNKIVMKKIKALYQLWKIFQIENVDIGDDTRNPLTGEWMSFTQRTDLRQAMLNKWLQEQGLIK
jgi:hypothetical protein